MQIVEEAANVDTLRSYMSVPISFHVESKLRVEAQNNGLGGLNLVEEAEPNPYIKDYDTDETERPANWPRRWDISNWGILACYEGEHRIGGAVVAFDTPGVLFLEGRSDIAALWDIRVAPHARRGGIGRALFSSAVQWARKRGCRLLKIETQNVNVGACRFYAAMGCVLGGINLFAYPGTHLEEVQLIWYLRLD